MALTNKIVPITQDVLAAMDPATTKIHCMGVGGVGVSAIAEMLVARGFQVSGSDIAENTQIAKLRQLGVQVYIGHAAEHVASADIAVYSSAIKAGNPEYDAAHARGIPLYQRAQMLAMLTASHQLLCVAGTHGKTTTTGMMVWVLHQAGMAPSFAVGGNLRNLDAYCQLTHGDYAVIEADESDASFLYYQPQLAILTNVDRDHLENYDGDYAQLRQAYIEFLQHLNPQGQVVLCADDAEAMQLLPEIKANVLTYGQAENAHYRLQDFKQQGLTSFFQVKRPRGETLRYKLNCPGLHNALNATAVIAMADYLQVVDQHVVQALRSFSGMGRRFQRLGARQVGAATVEVVEDYGHHPRELQVTLQAVRAVWPKRRIVLVFQPHRFSRVRHLWQEFMQVLAQADALLLLAIYPAGEKPQEGVTSQLMLQQMAEKYPQLPMQEYAGEDAATFVDCLGAMLQDHDVCVLAGAGSIGKLAQYIRSHCPRL